MTDIRSRFREADRIPVPDLWPDITLRQPARLPRGRGRSRMAMAALGLALAGLGIFVLARAFLSSSEQTRPVSPTPSSYVPVPKANGRIAFVRIDPETADEDGEIPEAAIYSVNPDGTELARLAQAASASTPAWSPDGTSLAFVAVRNETPGMFVMHADGTGITRVTSCHFREGCDGEGSPAWSPDGARLAFWSDRDGREGLWTVNVDGTGLALLAEGLSFGEAAWSPDGSLIAVNGNTVEDPARRLVFLVSDQTGEVVGEIRPDGIEPSFGISWSPDGQWLAFDAVGQGGTFEGAGIYVIRPDGSDLKLLTSWSCPPATCWALSPAWSPDGRQIAFIRGGDELDPAGLSGDLYTIDIRTGRVHQLTKGETNPDCCASWQPVGEH